MFPMEVVFLAWLVRLFPYRNRLEHVASSNDQLVQGYIGLDQGLLFRFFLAFSLQLSLVSNPLRIYSGEYRMYQDRLLHQFQV